METLAQKIYKWGKTPYQVLANKHNTSTMYVGQIARGTRNPTKGKGLIIKKDLEAMTQKV
jgi:hypothetical protein